MSDSEEHEFEPETKEVPSSGGFSFMSVLAIFFAGIIFAGLVYLLSDRWQYDPIIVQTAEIREEVGFAIYGAVISPGLYVNQGRLRVATAAALAGGLTDQADLRSANLSVWIRDGDTVVIPTLGEIQPTITLASTELPLININKATAEELMSLPGIGEKKAGDILAARDEKKGFHSVDELLEVKGISRKLLESIYDRLTVEQVE